KDRVDQRVHYVLDQLLNRADLSHHEGRIFGLDAEDDAHFELHRETVLRDHLERVEGVIDFARCPFDRLVRRRDDDGRHRQRVEVVTTRPDDRLLYAAIAIRNDVGFVRALIEALIGGVFHHEVLFDLLHGAVFVVELVEPRRRLREMLLFFAFEPLTNLRGHRTAHVFAGVFADVRYNDGDFARLDLFGRLRDHF